MDKNEETVGGFNLRLYLEIVLFVIFGVLASVTWNTVTEMKKELSECSDKK
jgi:hypothetical protein